MTVTQGTDTKLRPPPPEICSTCKGTLFWWRPANNFGPGGWLCKRYHGSPDEPSVKSISVSYKKP